MSMSGSLWSRIRSWFKKTAKIQVEPNGAHVADAQAIADQRVGGAAARDPIDAALAAGLQYTPDRQEVILVADLADDRRVPLPVEIGYREALAP